MNLPSSFFSEDEEGRFFLPSQACADHLAFPPPRLPHVPKRGRAVRQKKSRCFGKKSPRNPKNSPTFAKKWGSFCCHLCGGSEAMWSKPKKEGTGESTGAAIDVMFVRRQIFAILFVVHLAGAHRTEVIGGQLAVDNAVPLGSHALSEGN